MLFRRLFSEQVYLANGDYPQVAETENRNQL